MDRVLDETLKAWTMNLYKSSGGSCKSSWLKQIFVNISRCQVIEGENRCLYLLLIVELDLAIIYKLLKTSKLYILTVTGGSTSQ